MRKEKPNNKWLYIVLAILALLWVLGKTVKAQEIDSFLEPTKIRCTCYIDDGLTASGCKTRYGIMAAKSDLIGKTACVNAVNEDGSIGEFIGYFEILDTGYGRETGEGVSKIKKDKTLGTIEAGLTVDIYMYTLEDAKDWVKKYSDYVYITLVDAEG